MKLIPGFVALAYGQSGDSEAADASAAAPSLGIGRMRSLPAAATAPPTTEVGESEDDLARKRNKGNRRPNRQQYGQQYGQQYQQQQQQQYGQQYGQQKFNQQYGNNQYAGANAYRPNRNQYNQYNRPNNNRPIRPGGNQFGAYADSYFDYDTDSASSKSETFGNGIGDVMVGNLFNGDSDRSELNVGIGADAGEDAVTNELWDNDHINKYWEFMHRQWGHQQENRLGVNFVRDPTDFTQSAKASRWFHVTPERVINNLNKGYLKYQYPGGYTHGSTEHARFPVDRYAYLQAGRHGHNWGEVPGNSWTRNIVDNERTNGNWKFGWYVQPWLWDAGNIDNIHDVDPLDMDAANPMGSEIQHTFGFIDWQDANANAFAEDGEATMLTNADEYAQVSPARAPWYGKYFDASWEQGDSPAHFFQDGVNAQYTESPFDPTFSGSPAQNGGIDQASVAHFDRSNTASDRALAGWERYYSGYRWFDGIQNFVAHPSGVSMNTQTKNMHNVNEVDDPAKLKCHRCNEQAEMRWDNDFHTFKLVTRDHGSEELDNLDTQSGLAVDLWKNCFETLNQRSCEYSSGVCFVEERRVWGYVTQVRAGCQQSQACYMQKYQNFVVEAGRQCWPGDALGEDHKLAVRPDDMRADHWIYNIIKGGLMLKNKDNDATNQMVASHHYTEFGNTRSEDQYVDKFFPLNRPNLDNNGADPLASNGHLINKTPLTDGNYGVGRTGFEDYQKFNLGVSPPGMIDNSADPDTGAALAETTQFYKNYATNFQQFHQPIEYKNGLVPTSKCHQCCNTDHNCNWNWQPTTKLDWEFAYVWRYSTRGTLKDVDTPGDGEAGNETLEDDVANLGNDNFLPQSSGEFRKLTAGNIGSNVAIVGGTYNPETGTYAGK